MNFLQILASSMKGMFPGIVYWTRPARSCQRNLVRSLPSGVCCGHQSSKVQTLEASVGSVSGGKQTHWTTCEQSGASLRGINIVCHFL
jgi:hypothetical protein